MQPVRESLCSQSVSLDPVILTLFICKTGLIYFSLICSYVSHVVPAIEDFLSVMYPFFVSLCQLCNTPDSQQYETTDNIILSYISFLTSALIDMTQVNHIICTQ